MKTSQPEKTSEHEKSLQFYLIFAFSILLRLVLVPFSPLIGDESRILQLGLDFYHTGHLPTHGAAVVYSGTFLPGSLQAFMVGAPLYLAGGRVIATAVMIALWNSFGVWMIYRTYRPLFPMVPKFFLSSFIFLAPWTLLMVQIINPSYCFPIAAIFFWSLIELMKTKPCRWAGFWVIACLPMALQLHLSVASFVAVLLVLLGLRIVRFRSFGLPLAGAAFGSLGLIPYALEKFQSSGGALQVVSSNVRLNTLSFMQLPAYFLRFLSFATADVIRFISGGRGYIGIFGLLAQMPLLIPFALVSVLGAGWLIWGGLRFYIQELRKISLQGIRTLKDETDILKKADFLVMTTVFLTAGLYLFSIKGPSAHTFWSLSPLAFYPPLRIYSIKVEAGSIHPRARMIWTAYVLSGVIFAVVGYIGLTDIPRVKDFPGFF